MWSLNTVFFSNLLSSIINIMCKQCYLKYQEKQGGRISDLNTNALKPPKGILDLT